MNIRNALQVGAALMLGTGISCTSKNSSSSFVGNSKRLKAASTYTTQDGNAISVTPAPTPAVLATPRPDINYTEPGGPGSETVRNSFALTSALDVSLSANSVWAVTKNSISRIELDEAKGFPKYTWTIPETSAGTRTYVSEIGLLLGRTNHGGAKAGTEGIYVAEPSLSVGYQPIFKVGDFSPWMGAGSRMCVVSFVLDGRSYVGGAFFDSNNRNRFVRIPIDKSKPNGVDVAQKVVWDIGDANSDKWGYSCFIDQSRGVFWSSWPGASDILGVNLRTGQFIAASQLPNATHSVNYSPAHRPTKSVSYAISGDSDGNSLSFVNAYTATHETMQNLVYISNYDSQTLTVGKKECFSTRSDCTKLPGGGLADWNVGAVIGTGFGPLSSLNDGRIVAATRAANSEIWLIQPKDANNLLLGANLKKIAQLQGDAYMYTDFTGGTLYAAHVEKTIDLAASGSGYLGGIPVSDLKLKWTANSGTAESWVGLNLKLRCYAKGAAVKPAWISFLPGKAGEEKLVPCSGVVNTIDILVDGDGSSNFSRTKFIEISGKQNQG